ncbi:MAG: competence/damage-inducible protein A [Gemmatimonadota bacterium]
MKASVLAIGDEIVGGLTTDTNSGFLAQLLRSVGINVQSILAVPDDDAEIDRALARALEHADLVVATGGLGPTADDLTTAAVARLADVPLELHADSLEHISRRFRERGLEMPANNRRQALLPRGSTVLPNPLGTAPGFVLRIEGDERNAHVAALPGVPREMRRMAEEELVPWLLEHVVGRRIASRVFSVFGLSESRLDELLTGVVDGPDARLSFRAAFPRLQARVTVSGDNDPELEARLDHLESAVRERLGDRLYAVGDEGLEETVGRLLRDAGLSLALAESCTGGLIGHRITDVAGASAYFRAGVVAYSNEAKTTLLGVSPATLATEGAVSEAAVLEMARGARRASGAAIGVATSGVAGPGGGTAAKPVGTVWIAISRDGEEWAHRYQLGGRSRAWVKEMTAQLALDALRRSVCGLPQAPP